MTDRDPRDGCRALRLQRAALADFSMYAFRGNDIDDLLHRTCELVSEALGVPLVKVLEHFPERGELLVRSGVNWSPGVVGHETFGDHERSPGGYALRSGRPVVSPDLAREARFETPDVLLRHGVRGMVNVIVAGEGEAFGVLEVDARERRHFDDDDIAFLQIYANLLAAAIERIRAHHNLQHAAREQAVLARELGHRVKNLLGLIRALASQMPARDRTAEEFRAAFIDRLQTLATAENLVFDGGEDRVDPLALAQEVLAPYRQDEPGKIALDGESVGLTVKQARMFGLALHELATNAMKYGALGAEEGRVHVDWSVEPAGETRRLSVTWRETNGPEITPPERKGFGSRLLEDVVAYELKGEGELAYEPQGLRYHLAFPVDGDRA